ncbi:MAG: tyrosine-type recombinase/integrase [Raoultibacter sp.]
MSAAVDEEILVRNPHAKVKKPRVDTEEKTPLDKEQARRLIKSLNEDDPNAHTIGVLLALTCGLRRAEVLGLRWCDFDKEKRCIQVVRTLSADGREIKTTKTKAGRRTIPLDAATAKRLEDWKTVQGNYLLSLGLSQDGERYIVTSTTGGNMHPENLARWWKKYSKKNGLSGYSLHQLRHTYATLLVAQGTDIVTAKTLMGHTDTKMLTELYAHLVPENASRAVDMIGNTLYAEDDAEKKVIESEGKEKTA